MNRLLDFLNCNPTNTATLCRAEGKCFVRLTTYSRWKLEEKDFPIDTVGRVHKDFCFCCVGYGSTYEEALIEALSRLPS